MIVLLFFEIYGDTVQTILVFLNLKLIFQAIYQFYQNSYFNQTKYVLPVLLVDERYLEILLFQMHPWDLQPCAWKGSSAHPKKLEKKLDYVHYEHDKVPDQHTRDG